ncbi:hypothetical protein H7X65_00895 [Candidatus Parcubacteria bacterium]|nr:hypothetical protein [Candidatus Parcubacteria bacterium]
MHFNLCIRVVVVIMSIFFHLPSLNAEQSENTNLTPAEITELTSYISKEKAAKEPLSWKKEGDWFQSVIIFNGEKITFGYFPASGESKISLWWRKNGTSGRNTLWTSAGKSDGTVHSGVDPEKKKVALLYSSNPEYQGEQHRAYWQAELNKRLRAGLAYYRQVAKK